MECGGRGSGCGPTLDELVDLPGLVCGEALQHLQHRLPLTALQLHVHPYTRHGGRDGGRDGADRQMPTTQGSAVQQERITRKSV